MPGTVAVWLALARNQQRDYLIFLALLGSTAVATLIWNILP